MLYFEAEKNRRQFCPGQSVGTLNVLFYATVDYNFYRNLKNLPYSIVLLIRWLKPEGFDFFWQVLTNLSYFVFMNVPQCIFVIK